MSRRLSKRVWFALTVLGLTSGALVCRVPAADTRDDRRLHLSEAGSAEVLTNLEHLGSKAEVSRDLDAINRSFQRFTPKSSLDGAPPPAVRPAGRPMIQNKRVQELLERRKNWAYMSPEDLNSSLTPEELFDLPNYGPNGEEVKKLSPLERFYESMDSRRKAGEKGRTTRSKDPLSAKKPGSERDGMKGLGSDDDEEEGLPDGVRDREEALKKLVGKDKDHGSLGAISSHGTLSDIFGLGDNSLSPEQIRAHEDYMKRFQDLMNGAGPAPGAGSLNPLAPGDASAGFNPVAVPGGLPVGRPLVDPQLGMVSPSYAPPSAADLNARVLNQWNPFPTLPAPEPPKPAMPPPTFTAPRRAFQ